MPISAEPGGLRTVPPGSRNGAQCYQLSRRPRQESVNAAYSTGQRHSTLTRRICRATAGADCWSSSVAVHRFAVHSASPTARSPCTLVVHATNNHARPWPIHLVSTGSDWLAHVVRRVYGDARFTTRCVSQRGAFHNGGLFAVGMDSLFVNTILNLASHSRDSARGTRGGWAGATSV